MTNANIVGGKNFRQPSFFSLSFRRRSADANVGPAQMDQVNLSSRPVALRLGKQITRLPQDGTSLELGRSQDSPLEFLSPAVSRKHALLRSSGGQVEIMDLGSTNGTFINRKRIKSNKWVQLSGNQKLDFAGVPVTWKCLD